MPLAASASASASALTRRRGLAVPWLLIGGYTMAVLDLAVAMAYWVPLGVRPGRIPQSIAAWLLGPAAFSGGALTATLGVLIYGQLLWGVAMLYEAMARRYPLLLRRPLACGALYGMAAYVAIFELLTPWLFGVHPIATPSWVATCLLAYATVVGIPCALFTRAARAATYRA
jgi:hypothetical protein